MPTVKLGDVAIEAKETYKGDKTGYPIVGLEHITPEEVTLSNWSVDTENTFTKMFRKDDILFGRRRAYLKKAAIAPFDGICSGDITVIRAKSEKLLPMLLPFVIQNDDFFEYAVGKSAGSLSPRVKWEHLKNYEFNLPSLKKQKELADLLWSINDSRKAYQELLRETDELIKSQFIEMFGDPETNSKCIKTLPISEVVSLLRNGATIKQTKDKEGYPITRIETISNRTVDREKMGYAGITSLEKYEDYVLQDGDILMSHINSITHMGKSALYKKLPDEKIIHGMNLLCLRPIAAVVNPTYLYRYFQMDYFYQQVMSITKPAVNQASMTIRDLGAQTILIPDMKDQIRFVDFVEQSDKSKFELKQAIEGVDNLIRSLVQQELK